MDYEFATDAKGTPCLNVKLSDYALLATPLLNKGTAFTHAERIAFKLLGLLPPNETTLELQCQRSYEAFCNKPSDIEKYIYLRELQDSNETLFYRLIHEHLEELMPIVYTPTVGLGCQRFSHIYRRPRGVFISYPDRDSIETILSHPRFENVRAVVVSDGERILGLGDQGAGGMGIPIGKLALYTACAGIYPGFTLPIFLDVGTNNTELQKDPLYIGWRHERIRGTDYDHFVAAFVTAIKKRFPHVLLQWEDFAQQNANPLLERYRHELCTFNDDIQGTAAVAAGTLFSAIKVTGIALRDQRIAVAGAGSAGCGISLLLLQAMMDEGLPESEAKQRFFLVDRDGLLTENTASLLPFQKPFAQTKNKVANWKCDNANHITLKEVVRNVHPTLLIGVSGQYNLFTEDLVVDMAAHVERPIIFPLSNPTSRSEATPSDLMKWTNDRALVGTGSPFGEIKKKGKSCRVDQTNNSYIFPGMGLGLIVSKAKYVSNNMFMAAAKALADCSPAKLNPDANLLPPLTHIRDISFKIAVAVAKQAMLEGVANVAHPANIEKEIQQFMWMPNYLPYNMVS